MPGVGQHVAEVRRPSLEGNQGAQALDRARSARESRIGAESLERTRALLQHADSRTAQTRAPTRAGTRLIGPANLNWPSARKIGAATRLSGLQDLNPRLLVRR